MKFHSKRHKPKEEEPDIMLIRELEFPTKQLDKSERLRLVKEKFMRRKAEFHIKKNLIKTSKKLNAINGRNKNDDEVKF